MQITQVIYKALFNLGDYSNETIGLVAKLEPDDSPEEAIEALRQQAVSKAGLNANKVWQEKWAAERDLRNLQRQIDEAAKHWENVQAFLKAQGINPEAPNMPIFAPQLNPSPEVEVVEMDGDDDEYDENDDDGEVPL
jgi:hypothetical protein